MAKKFKLSKISLNSLNKWYNNAEIENDNFKEKFLDVIVNDVKNIKDCSEKMIVEHYIKTANSLLKTHDISNLDNIFWDKLKSMTRTQLADKCTLGKVFDNNIDIYFNEVKREYILHPQNESEDMEFIPENRDIFIKNNLKLVIDCAKRYQNLGLPFEDLIQIGNIGLLNAFEKFDTDRANLRFDIIKDINSHLSESFTYDEAIKIIKDNFKYAKLLDATIKKIPNDGFTTKRDFIEWTQLNIKTASFSSVSFAWIRASIISELNKYSKIIKVPKSIYEDKNQSIGIVRLDSVNPHTDSVYHDNQMSDIANEEFVIEDEMIERIETENTYKEFVNSLLLKLDNLSRRIIKKKFGIDCPFPLSIDEICEFEGISQNKCKQLINNSMKIISENISESNRKILREMLK